jgi:hypothetical protein
MLAASFSESLRLGDKRRSFRSGFGGDLRKKSTARLFPRRRAYRRSWPAPATSSEAGREGIIWGAKRKQCPGVAMRWGRQQRGILR